MAKSLRSKRRQKILGVRRKKVREREVKKMWEKHLLKQNGERMLLEGLAEANTGPSNEQSVMEVTAEKISNSEIKKIQEKWGTRRSINKKLKAKRKKGHAQW